jgi:sialidase-1
MIHTLPPLLHRVAASGFAIVWILTALCAWAAEPRLEKTDLFQAGTEGYALYRIPGIVVTTQGTLLAYCEARKTGKGDWGAIDIMLRRSSDGGRTWQPRRQIAHFGPKVPKNPVALRQKLATEEETTVDNPVAIVDRQTGLLHFLYCVEYARCFYIRSEDDGQSFSQPVDITATFERFRPDYDWKVIATGPGHGIQLQNGRLVAAVWMSTGTGGHAHRPSVSSVIFSDDHGRTWQRGEIAVPNTQQYVYPSETVLVQLADGSVMLNVRSESPPHRRLITTSKDGAAGWSKPEFHPQLLEPICMASMVRLSQQPGGDKNRLLFVNPHNLDRGDGKAKPGVSRDRKNLSVKLSYDEGKTWPVNKVLEPGYSAYSDLAVGPDDTIYCFYERGTAEAATKRPTSYSYLTLARFNLEWLTDGQDQLRAAGERLKP